MLLCQVWNPGKCVIIIFSVVIVIIIFSVVIVIINVALARNAFVSGLEPRKVRPTSRSQKKLFFSLRVDIGLIHSGSATRDPFFQQRNLINY